MEREVVRTNDEMVKLCGDACFNAFKFVSSVDSQVIQSLIFSMTEIMKLQACHLCQKHFDLSMEAPTIHYEGSSQAFCSKPCQNVFVMQKRKIVPCTYCKVGNSHNTLHLKCSYFQNSSN